MLLSSLFYKWRKVHSRSINLASHKPNVTFPHSLLPANNLPFHMYSFIWKTYLWGWWMSQRVKVCAMWAQWPKFNLHNPLKGRRWEPIVQNCLLTSTCIYVNPNTLHTCMCACTHHSSKQQYLLSLEISLLAFIFNFSPFCMNGCFAWIYVCLPCACLVSSEV